MKVLQTQFQCMKEQLITLDHLWGVPSEIYPNSEIYCYHDFYEMEYFAKGNGIHYINGIPYHVQPGYLYFLIPGDSHYMQLDTQQEYELWNLKLSVTIPEKQLSEELNQLPRPLCTCLPRETSAFFLNELHFLNSCLNGNWSALMAKNSANRLLTVAHYLFSTSAPVASVSTNDCILQLIQYIETNYHKALTLSDIAAFLDLSEGYAGVYFKNITGMHFSHFLNRTRLFHAARLLRETTGTIKEIAFSVGFHSPEYLTRLFTASFGMSPRNYRRSLLHKPNL